VSTADEIRDLLFAYCWHLDRGEYDDVRELFVDPSAAGDLDETFVRPIGAPTTKHVCSNAIITLADSGTEASVRSYFLAQQQLEDFPLQPVAAGRYHDTVVLVGGSWRFVERRVLRDFIGDTSRYLRSEIDA
jgi:SnoaL-like domain